MIKIMLLEKALQMAENENKKLNEDLRKKSQEIANLLIATERKNRTIDNIKEYVEEAIEKARLMEDKSILVPLLNMSMQISENQTGDCIQERYEKEYNFYNNEFLRRLSTRYPILNMNERKVCMYIRMNRNTKEIATLLNLSVRGVETIRFHLRKKMRLKHQDNLSIFLAGF